MKLRNLTIGATLIAAALGLSACGHHHPHPHPTPATSPVTTSVSPTHTTASPTPSPTSSVPSATCYKPNAPEMHIYHPDRLAFQGCETVTGTIISQTIEADGDIHVRMQLDPQFAFLLQGHDVTSTYPGGNGHQHGLLVIEDPCSSPDPVTQTDAQPECVNYHSPWPRFITGDRYSVEGAWVLDQDHYGWAEIHGLTNMHVIN